MSETLGSLVDKLSICNLKLWFVQEKTHRAAREGSGLDAETVRRLNDLNLQRNSLMNEIDGLLNVSIQQGHARFEPRIKITE
jgi:hypothetical protein